MDFLNELIIKRNKLKSDIDELSVEYYLNDEDGKLPILSEILELRMRLTNLQNEIIDLQSAKLTNLKNIQENTIRRIVPKIKRKYPGV